MRPLHIKRIVLVAMLLATDVMSGYAQLAWDDLGVEAFISDHKNTRSLIETRGIIEQGNKVLHSASDESNADYRDVNEQLDKYTKAFDVIDIVFNSVSTGFNIYKTVDNVSDKVGKYKSLISDFQNKIVKRGKMELPDTIILTINQHAIEDIYAQSKELYTSVGYLASYSTGTLLATTATINHQILTIDQCLTNIRDIINRAYFETYTYIRSRTTFWNRKTFTEKTKLRICNEAWTKWRQRSRNVKVTK